MNSGIRPLLSWKSCSCTTEWIQCQSITPEQWLSHQTFSVFCEQLSSNYFETHWVIPMTRITDEILKCSSGLLCTTENMKFCWSSLHEWPMQIRTCTVCTAQNKTKILELDKRLGVQPLQQSCATFIPFLPVFLWRVSTKNERKQKPPPFFLYCLPQSVIPQDPQE